VQLADDYALGAIDNEGASGSDQRQFARNTSCSRTSLTFLLPEVSASR
jgi:hypothetical protein